MQKTPNSQWLTVVAAAVVSFPLAATAQEACTTYTVQQGEGGLWVL
jgi:hypothetical protein